MRRGVGGLTCILCFGVAPIVGVEPSYPIPALADLDDDGDPGGAMRVAAR